MTSRAAFLAPRFCAAALAFVLLGGIGAVSSFAQNAAPAPNSATMPNAFQGFTRNRKDPVKIEANSLEVRDKEKAAVFTGNVVVQQGDTIMRCKQLIVHYEGNALSGDTKQLPASQQKQQNTSAQRIKRLVAEGGVIVTAKDQKATGDQGVFEMQTNTVTLIGNVIVTQGPNVMRGDKLVVDLTSGRSRMDAAGKGGPARVQGLFIPNTVKGDEKKDQTNQKDRPARKRQPQTN